MGVPCSPTIHRKRLAVARGNPLLPRPSFLEDDRGDTNYRQRCQHILPSHRKGNVPAASGGGKRQSRSSQTFPTNRQNRCSPPATTFRQPRRTVANTTDMCCTCQRLTYSQPFYNLATAQPLPAAGKLLACSSFPTRRSKQQISSTTTPPACVISSCTGMMLLLSVLLPF